MSIKTRAQLYREYEEDQRKNAEQAQQNQAEAQVGAEPGTTPPNPSMNSLNGSQQDQSGYAAEFVEYPIHDPAIYYGIIGELVKEIAPHTEADPVAILVQFLIGCGCVIGPGPYFQVGATKHYARTNACLVRRTSKGRKGSALDYVTYVLKQVDSKWAENNITTGLSSGEGLIYAVRDEVRKREQIKKGNIVTGAEQEVITDFGVDDKRLFVTETEFFASA
jgi:hypothetical protein